MPRTSRILTAVAVMDLPTVYTFAHYFGHQTSGTISSRYGELVVYLDQAEAQGDRDTPTCEVADSQELFRPDENIERFGLIPSPPDSKSDPDGLSIGVTKQETLLAPSASL